MSRQVCVYIYKAYFIVKWLNQQVRVVPFPYNTLEVQNFVGSSCQPRIFFCLTRQDSKVLIASVRIKSTFNFDRSMFIFAFS